MKIAKRCVSCGGQRLKRSPAVLMPFVAARVFGWEPIEIRPEWGFRDLPADRACSVCQSLMCEDCGMLFLDMRFDDEEMGALYDDYRGLRYTALRDRFEPGYAARNAIFADGSTYLSSVEATLASRVPEAPRVLDWGGDSGLNTPFRHAASAHHVYDISGCPVVEGARTVTLNEARSETYDLITSMQVLEHLPSPRETLDEIAATMKPETLLYVEMPHEDLMRSSADPHERLARKRHWHEHINFFTPESLDALFKTCGLTIIERTSHPVHAGGKDWHNFRIVAKRAA